MAKSSQRKRITPNHEAIVDWEILHPGGTMLACAADIGMADSSISIIRNSDIFKDYRTRRLQAHHANISSSVIEKAELLACTTLDVMNERIDAERKNIALGGVVEVADMALKALGFGQSKGGNGGGSGAAVGNVTVVVGASPEMLEAARQKMRTINPSPPPTSLEKIEDATIEIKQLPSEAAV